MANERGTWWTSKWRCPNWPTPLKFNTNGFTLQVSHSEAIEMGWPVWNTTRVKRYSRKSFFCVFRELPWSQDITFSMLDYSNLQSVTALECFKLTEASLIFDVHDIGCLSDLSLPVKMRHSHVWNNFPLFFAWRSWRWSISHLRCFALPHALWGW